jgi:butyryl-CoA dehydrogenase/short/branched chain acyl-CoA dehydrogenase
MIASEERAVSLEKRAAPLTHLSEEERMFQATVRKFARERIAPHVRAMDEAGVFRTAHS